MRWSSNRKLILVLFLLLWVSLSCNNEREQQICTCLQQWDNLLENHPESVPDSLCKLDPQRLSPANRAYHGLLSTIADDKTYVEFGSDSLISEVERYYGKHQPGTENHLRSLIYQCIVRIRMGVTDTTAYLPLEKAKKIFAESKDQTPLTGYLLNFYLGKLHYQEGNHYLADFYYKKSLGYARKDEERHVFDAYAALFWNEMTQENYDVGKLYLDTLLKFEHVSTDIKYNILNMQSAYYDMEGDFTRSLQYEKDMLELLPLLRYKVDKFRTLFSISDRYKSVNQLDSALLYGLQAFSI